MLLLVHCLRYIHIPIMRSPSNPSGGRKQRGYTILLFPDCIGSGGDGNTGGRGDSCGFGSNSHREELQRRKIVVKRFYCDTTTSKKAIRLPRALFGS